MFSFGEIFVFGLLAVLLFGKQLPQVGKQFGKTVAQLKRSYDAFQREVHSVMSEVTDMSEPTPSSTQRRTDASLDSDDVDRMESMAPKFEPPKHDS
ncbi:MAG: twin-arginine translocase TatA/TatE family subunit [Planctomycetia bacterium]|nr:twin-arginine translocase TatA/TatE family subunit [Planctomycetia bacterium]